MFVCFFPAAKRAFAIPYGPFGGGGRRRRKGPSLLMPPGAMSLKIQVVFPFFFSVENVHFNWIIRFSGTCDVFFCRE